MPKLLLTLALVVLSVLTNQRLPAEGLKTTKEDLSYLRLFAAATGADKILGWHAGSDPCEELWSGVYCDNAGKVNIMDVQDKGLSGTVPDVDENGSLSMLEDLRIGGNRFTGKVPMLPLPRLRYLRLDGNAFTSMPKKFFTEIPELRDFNMSNNPALTGWSICDELSSLRHLRLFEASHASISGTLDVLSSNGTAYFPFPHLTKLSLAGNRLSGAVPDIKGNAMKTLDLSDNQLTGSINFISDLAPSLESLSLSHNSFTGPMPDFTNFNRLQYLHVDHNRITGIVPGSLPQLSVIVVVRLAGNLLQGPVPEFGLSVDTDVAKAAASGSFCRLDHGPCNPEVESLLLIAGAFGYPSSFATNWLRNDACAGWMGVHCDNRHKVTGINLSRIGLSGTMDRAFGTLPSLKAILLSGNNIHGEIPASVAQLPSLRVIDVTNNNLSGTVPKFRDGVAVWAEGNPYLKLSGSSLSAPSMVGVLVAMVVPALPFFRV